MSTAQRITIGFGKENFKTRSVRLATRILTNKPWDLKFPTQVNASHGVTVVGKAHAYPATIFPEINGIVYTQALDVADGVIFVVTSQEYHSASLTAQGAYILRVRAEGPLLQIMAKLPTTEVGRLNPDAHPIFTGRADILDRNDLLTLGVSPRLDWYKNHTDKDELEEVFKVNVTAKARSAKPTFTKVKNQTGETVVVSETKAVRRIRVRKD